MDHGAGGHARGGAKLCAHSREFFLWTLGWYSELGLGRASKNVVLQATLAVLVGNEKHSPR